MENINFKKDLEIDFKNNYMPLGFCFFYELKMENLKYWQENIKTYISYKKITDVRVIFFC